MKPLAIVGLDPGTTTAFAALTLQGDLLTFFSAKELSLSDVIRELITVCHPVIAATDKSKVPTFIEQFSRKMGTDTIYPHEDLAKEEKRQIISAWIGKNNIKLNHHEADALAAALYAYKHHQPFLEKTYNYIEANNLHSEREEFIRIALNRELHFDVIKEILTKNKEEKKIIYEALVDNKITKKDFLRLYTKLDEIKKENAVLELKLSASFEKIESLQSAQKKVANIDDQVQKRLDHLVHHKEERLRLLTQKIETVQKQLQQVQAKSHQLNHFITGMPGKQLIKKIASLSYNEYTRTQKKLNLQYNDYIFVENPSIYSNQILSILQQKNCILLSNQKAPTVVSQVVPVLQIKREELDDETEYFAVIPHSTLEQYQHQKDVLERVIYEYKNRKSNPITFIN